MRVALALGQTEWEADFMSLLSHPMLNLKVVRRCVDGIDLLAAVKIHEIDLVVVTDVTLRVGSSEIAHLHNENVVIVAISNSAGQWNEIGVTNVIDFTEADLFAIATQLAKVVPEADSIDPRETSVTHKLVCVASFGGGVGRSLVSKELGWWNSKRAAQTFVVEGDTYGASLLQELNLPALTTDLPQLSQVNFATELDEFELNQLAIVEPNLAIVPGLSHSSHWPVMHRAQLDRMWKKLINVGEVIVDVGPVFCSFENANHEIKLISRDLVAESAISAAKAVVFCALANTVSVTRLIRGVIDNQNELRNHEVYVVLNRSRSAKSAKELTQLIKRHTGIEQVYSLPDDSSALEHIEVKCEFLGKLRPKAEISHQLHELSLDVFKPAQQLSTQIQEQRLQRATAA